jgi:hypothetical protein
VGGRIGTAAVLSNLDGQGAVPQIVLIGVAFAAFAG